MHGEESADDLQPVVEALRIGGNRAKAGVWRCQDVEAQALILDKRRGRWWVYLKPGSVAQDELVFGLCNKDQHSTNMILDWLAQNVSGGWRESARVVHRKGDYRDFVAVPFSDYDDALMFFLAFEQQGPVVDVKEPDLWIGVQKGPR